MRTITAIIPLLCCVACSEKSEPAPAQTTEAPAPDIAVIPSADPIDSIDPLDTTYPFAYVIGAYSAWPDVYASLRWAPTLCIARVPTGERTSDAPAASPHGRKVYNLRVSDLNAFTNVAIDEPPIGFAAVKIAYTPNPDAPHQPGAFVGLFMMKRIADADDPSTDNGWVYATTDADLHITESGRIASCMKCHADAPHGRLFGPQEESHRAEWR